jgi:hypothetical protein
MRETPVSMQMGNAGVYEYLAGLYHDFVLSVQQLAYLILRAHQSLLPISAEPVVQAGVLDHAVHLCVPVGRPCSVEKTQVLLRQRVPSLLPACEDFRRSSSFPKMGIYS